MPATDGTAPADDGRRVVLFAGGGSGGHLYPGIAVAEELAKLRPDLRPLFLCTQREIDRTILEPTGYEFLEQPIVPLRRSVGGLLRFWINWRATNEQVGRVLKRRQPVAVLGLGGYAAGVAVKRGAKAGLPAAILNPDVVPGAANKYLMRYCRAVCCGFEATIEHVPPEHREKCVVTGCPIRPDLLEATDRAEAAGRLGLDPLLNTLVVTGASQGARTVNDAVLEVLQRLKETAESKEARPLQGWQVLHLAGADHAEQVRGEYRGLGLEQQAKVIDFTPAMGDIWAVADLAISRSGASSCAELLARGIPAVLMPYPFHRDRHQLANARELERAGAAVIVEDTKDRRRTGDLLLPVMEALLYDAARREGMAKSARAAAMPDAARTVAEALAEMIGAT